MRTAARRRTFPFPRPFASACARPRATPCLTWLLGAAITLLVSSRVLAGEDYDRWYIVLLDGQRCGWNHEQQVTEGDHITTTASMNLRIRRGRDEIGLEMESRFVESADGVPISSRSRQVSGADAVTRNVVWTPAGVRITTEQGGRRSEDTRQRPGEEYLTPAEVVDFVRARLREEAQTIQYKSIDPTEGLGLVETTISDVRAATVEVGGRRVRAFAGRMSVSNAPGLSPRTWLDDTGKAVRSEIPLGGLTLVLELSDERTAMRRTAAPEVMVNTLIHPNRAIDQPRRVRSASYVLSTTTPDATLPEIPETSVQSVERLSGGRVRVTIDADQGRAADVESTEVYLESNASMDLEDSALRDMAREALGRTRGDDGRRAEALRRAVFRHITDKTLGVGFGSASETCRTRVGDCTEHAVLLGALLRIEGIPSRVVSGLVYADEFLGAEGVFGFHMWTQALLEVEGERRWVDLDAALSSSSAFDATHIALVVTSLDDDVASRDLGTVATVLGALKVDVRRAGR